ncbi:hypothetical protein [Sulfurimonas lithotrophica]|nr:hypothetical protein [Sulfurimonas lithotrophica]
MIKKTIAIAVYLGVFSVFLTGCSSFQEKYKPLYQVKPTVEKIEED